MASGGGWDEDIAENKDKGFSNHSLNSVTSDGPIYCIGGTKDDISAEEFQEFINGHPQLDLV